MAVVPNKFLMAVMVLYVVGLGSLMPTAAAARAVRAPKPKGANTTLLTAFCNDGNITAGSSLFDNLNVVFQDLHQNTATSGYFYRAQKSGGNSSAHGQAICNQRLSQDLCTHCLGALTESILEICTNAVGGRVQLVDCFVRYEDHNFP